MQTYRLTSGHTVTIQRGRPGIEFVTRNAQGETISSVTRSLADSVPLIKRLQCSGTAI
ncbi:hypothetical protein AB0958_21950 [Streptomyces sp. NPDC006655]|uniref:hypothetical protein n=1 Tax=Streptomyces sp. NPDC006655 TaxID=3156898 RepID=UPI00345577BF